MELLKYASGVVSGFAQDDFVKILQEERRVVNGVGTVFTLEEEKRRPGIYRAVAFTTDGREIVITDDWRKHTLEEAAQSAWRASFGEELTKMDYNDLVIRDAGRTYRRLEQKYGEITDD